VGPIPCRHLHNLNVICGAFWYIQPVDDDVERASNPRSNHSCKMKLVLVVWSQTWTANINQSRHYQETRQKHIDCPAEFRSLQAIHILPREPKRLYACDTITYVLFNFDAFHFNVCLLTVRRVWLVFKMCFFSGSYKCFLFSTWSESKTFGALNSAAVLLGLGLILASNYFGSLAHRPQTEELNDASTDCERRMNKNCRVVGMDGRVAWELRPHRSVCDADRQWPRSEPH